MEIPHPLRELARIDLSDPTQRDLSDYELLEGNRRGGMGVVGRARQHGLPTAKSRAETAFGRTCGRPALIEIGATKPSTRARLQHPNIVVVHGMGEHVGLGSRDALCSDGLRSGWTSKG